MRRFLTPEVFKQVRNAANRRKSPRWDPHPLPWILLLTTYCSGDSLPEKFEAARGFYVVCCPKRKRPGKSFAGFEKAVAKLPTPILRAFEAVWDAIKGTGRVPEGQFSKIALKLRKIIRGPQKGLNQVELSEFIGHLDDSLWATTPRNVTEAGLNKLLLRGNVIAHVDGNHWVRVIRIFSKNGKQWVHVFDAGAGGYYDQLLTSFMTRTGPIVSCTANEPRPTNGRPENKANKFAWRIINNANINKNLMILFGVK